MTSATLFSKVYSWVNLSINADLSTPIVIMKSFQDISQPAQTFISIDPIGRISRVGMPYKSALDNDAEGTIKNTYRTSLSIRQVGGVGEYLQKLIDNYELQSVQDNLYSAGLSLSTFGDIISMPSLIGAGNWKQEKWVPECVMEVVFLFASENTITSNWIETVDITNNINQGD